MENWNLETYPDFISFIDKESKAIDLRKSKIKSGLYSYLSRYAKARIDWFFEFDKNITNPSKEELFEYDKRMVDFRYAGSYVNSFLLGFFRQDFKKELSLISFYIEKQRDVQFIGISADGANYLTSVGKVAYKRADKIMFEDIKLGDEELCCLFSMILQGQVLSKIKEVYAITAENS